VTEQNPQTPAEVSTQETSGTPGASAGPAPVQHKPSARSKLAQLHNRYETAKTKAKAAADELKVITDGIKAELAELDPEAQRFELLPAGKSQAKPLALSYVENWTLDTKRLKAEDPVTWVRYAKRGGSWRLAEIKAEEQPEPSSDDLPAPAAEVPQNSGPEADPLSTAPDPAAPAVVGDAASATSGPDPAPVVVPAGLVPVGLACGHGRQVEAGIAEMISSGHISELWCHDCAGTTAVVLGGAA